MVDILILVTILFLFLGNAPRNIQASINVKRRRKFVAEYKRIQERKQSDARNRLGLELPFEVPEFPIP